MKQLQFLTFFIFLSFAASTQVFEVDTIQYMGDVNDRINLVILGDGYTEMQLGKFENDAQNFSNDFFNASPYKEYQNYFNVFIIKVPSNQSGATHPGTASDVNEPLIPVQTVDNYFGSAFDQFNIHRLLIATKTNKINQVLANNFPLYDQTIVLTNSPHYGGSGGQFPCASLNEASSEIAIHELGHSFVDLSDEYFAGNVFSRESINMTRETDQSQVKWKNWVNTDGIGIYQHCCGGNSAFWNKPHQNCKMQFLGRPFCAVCIEGTIEKIHSITSPVDSYTPVDAEIVGPSFPLELSIDLLAPSPNTIKIDWLVNGEMTDHTGALISINEEDLQLGSNTVNAMIEDTTEMLRIDNHASIHFNTVAWTVDYTVTGIHKVKGTGFAVDIEIFPNPTSGIFQINLKEPTRQPIRIDISNAEGQYLESTFLNNSEQLTIDLTAQSDGVYNLAFSQESAFLGTRKIVIQK